MPGVTGGMVRIYRKCSLRSTPSLAKCSGSALLAISFRTPSTIVTPSGRLWSIPRPGNVYLHTTYGIFNCHDRDGNLLWEISMMERFGRLTFPNGQRGSLRH